METVNIAEMKRLVAAELGQRSLSSTSFSYAEKRDGKESLYGLTGAVHIMAAIGLSFGSREQRAEAVRRILSWRKENGQFDNGYGPGHALHMVLGALNLLGEPIPADLGPLAPLEPEKLEVWLENHDWSSTHKELCGQTIPLLASGRVSTEWIRVFVKGISARLHSGRPLETWCEVDAPPWRVISCMYHILSAFDAGRLPYPQPDLLVQRLLDLRWEYVRDAEHRTECTDGDWALMLLHLCQQLPHHYEHVMRAIRLVSARRVQEWQKKREMILALDTHHIFCYLWVTALFQSHVHGHYTAGYLRDTLNTPALYCL